MKVLVWVMASLFFIAGCSAGPPLYYHERSDGTRYYQTVTEQLVRVDKDGWVVEAPVMYGGYRKQLQKKGDDWDLSGYDIVAPPGHCVELLSRRPESCLNRVWEPVALVLMAPILSLPGMPLLGDPPPETYGPGVARGNR
ncbi:MAG: hypothetical protein EPO02_00495 [Nitrospirae bacterium]|nr:MAG: hypothetical protein EPO02_00495 [Nitrospirota bacterium]